VKTPDVGPFALVAFDTLRNVFIPELWVVGLGLGAAARLTRFITRDTLTKPLREWVEDRYGEDSLPDEFIGCPWCVGFWISFLIAALIFCPVIANHPAFVIPATALTISHLIGLAARWLDPK
jgi:hypothetical protein